MRSYSIKCLFHLVAPTRLNALLLTCRWKAPAGVAARSGTDAPRCGSASRAGRRRRKMSNVAWLRLFELRIREGYPQLGCQSDWSLSDRGDNLIGRMTEQSELILLRMSAIPPEESSAPNWLGKSIGRHSEGGALRAGTRGAIRENPSRSSAHFACSARMASLDAANSESRAQISP
jgi:hypothetical protein